MFRRLFTATIGTPAIGILAALALMTASCSLTNGEASGGHASPAKASAAKASDEPASSAKGMGLPCFGCHAGFGQPGGFPHDTHRQMGLHCNQCHLIKAHQSITLNPETCKQCHNLKSIDMKLTAMPASFNHEGHASMFKCGECHGRSGLFKMKANVDKITMDRINSGKDCGKCHNGKTAFNADNCGACHKSM